MSPEWSLGSQVLAGDTPAEISGSLRLWLASEGLNAESQDVVLFWDFRLELPDMEVVARIAGGRGDCWHVGPHLGLAGLPRALDYVKPTWLYNLDPVPGQGAISWRLSLRACLVRVEVLRQLGGPDPSLVGLDAAGLDMGYRYHRSGAFVWYTPALLASSLAGSQSTISLDDELRFVVWHHGWLWAAWVAFRSVALGGSPIELVAALRRVRLDCEARERDSTRDPRSRIRPTPYKREYWRGKVLGSGSLENERVSILIPTLDRYDYLRTELAQLTDQTVAPLEIVIVDQTPPPERISTIAAEFPHLPIRYLAQDTTGQCSAWNAALEAASGDYFLFLGDDADRLGVDFIERFLGTITGLGADAVASAVEEAGAGPISESFSFLRTSDTFSITLARRSLFERAGLMDLAYDRGARADADLAVRAVLSGAHIVLDPDIRPFHHRAPRGGLRRHGARVITRASSRKSLLQRHLPSRTEFYLALRFFTARQVREMSWIAMFGTLTCEGHRPRKVLRFAINALRLPGSFFRLRATSREAAHMLKSFPKIPQLSTRTSDSARRDSKR
jgi:GT2 family glycosyltransferase